MLAPPGALDWLDPYKYLATAPRTDLFTHFQMVCDEGAHAARRQVRADERAAAKAYQCAQALIRDRTWSARSSESESEYSSDEHFSEWSDNNDDRPRGGNHGSWSDDSSREPDSGEDSHQGPPSHPPPPTSREALPPAGDAEESRAAPMAAPTLGLTPAYTTATTADT